MDTPGFAVNEGKGFTITFPNGITLSTQIGPGNYCENFDMLATAAIPRRMESRTAELAVWGAKGEWITERMMAALPAELIDGRDGDDVVPHAPVALWVAAVAWCAAQD